MLERYLPLIIIAQLSAVAGGAWLFLSPGFADRSVSLQRMVAVVLAIIMAFCMFIASEPRPLFSDFGKAYYPAGRAVLHGPQALAPLIDSAMFANMFVNLPIVAYVFAPFGLLSQPQAAMLFFILGIAVTVAAWSLLARQAQLSEPESWLLLFLFAANGPLINSLREGNTSHIVLLGLVAGYMFLQQKRSALAGIVLGLSALIKLPLLVFGVYFVLKRNWKSAAGFASALAVAGILSLVVFGWRLNWRWFELGVLQFGDSSIAAFNVQSISGFQLRLNGGASVLRDWSVVELSWPQRLIRQVLAVFMLVAVAIACVTRPPFTFRREGKEWDGLEYSLVVVLCLVTSPVSWSHYYSWLLMPFAFFLGMRTEIVQSSAMRRTAWFTILLASPLVSLPSFPNAIWQNIYAKIAVSHFLAAGLIWFGLLIWLLVALFHRRVRLDEW